jgi:exonuclease SbcC
VKILSLTWKNLNSLYGQWSIDFTHPEYESDGIFALVGPTGAGKSTILDAICLALYGQTPRLGKITKSGNEIMSRNTGECFSEVVFKSSQGTFRCTWGQHRARKRSEGNLLEAHHEISDALSGKPIETKKSLVPSVIEEKTGMDFDRFRRSILLAQGNFDTFLKADAEQKSKILEQITGTQIYSTISQKVYERLKGEKQSLDLLNQSISGITLLTDEEYQVISTQISQLQDQEKSITTKVLSLNRAIQWLQDIGEIEQELESFEGKRTQLLGEKEAFKKNYTKLDKALRAGKIDAMYQLLHSKRETQKRELLELHSKKAEQKVLQEKIKEINKALKEREEEREILSSEIERQKPIIKKVRVLDQSLAAVEKQHIAVVQTIEVLEKTLKGEKSQLSSFINERSQVEETQATKKNYLQEHQEDEKLIHSLSGLKEQINSLQLKLKHLKTLEKNLKEFFLDEFRKSLVVMRTQQSLFELKESLTNLKTQMREKEILRSNLLGEKQLREYKADKDHLQREQILLAKIEQLEDERVHLIEGNPCPLCGSLTHPFSDHTQLPEDENEKAIETLTTLITNCEQLDEEIRVLNEKINLILQDVKNGMLSENREKDSLQATYKKSEEAMQDILEERSNINTSKASILDQLAPYHIDSIEDNSETILSTLELLLQAYNSAQESLHKNSDVLHEIESKISSTTKTIELYEKNLEEHKKSERLLQGEYSSLASERKTLYGTKDPDDEELLLEAKLQKAKEREEDTRNNFSNLQKEDVACETTIGSLTVNSTQRASELTKDEEQFIKSLSSLNFKNEEDFLDSRLSSDTIEALTNEEKRLETKSTEISAHIESCTQRLAQQRQKELTKESLESLINQVSEQQFLLDGLKENISTEKFKLLENEQAKERVKERAEEIAKQQKEVEKWEKLSSLIGSADGKKFRNYAQGLTFDVMISHANDQLKRMNDRYILSRDPNQVLELNVIDNYQGGEVRSTKNLSGGESFIISLSLALGLSQMASKKVRVDSLFLDEGFGTLDDNALDSALETLSTLQQEGKIIGIISHVSLLKERINTKIVVTPTTGGKSLLEGPGITRG